VTYSDAAEVKLALTAMDAAGKAAAEAALQTLRADGQTNLWQENGWNWGVFGIYII
jgi:hypothetical protein